jgi:hypothetical protein
VQGRVALNVLTGLDQLLEGSALDDHELALLTLSYAITNPKAVEMLRGAIANLRYSIAEQLHDDDGFASITDGPLLRSQVHALGLHRRCGHHPRSKDTPVIL